MRRILTLFLSLCLCAPAVAGELEERQLIFDSVRAAFLNGEFEALDRMAEEYLAEQSRTGSGVWKLAAFYAPFNYPAFIFGEYSEQAFVQQFERLERWLAVEPSSRTAQIVTAMTIVDLAWFYRGGDYADNLTEEQVAGFLTYLEAGYHYLLSIKGSTASDPQWYVVALKIFVGLGVSDEVFDPMFDEAIRRHPGYHELLFALVRRHLPIWSGTRESLDASIRHVIAASPDFDEEAYARAYWFAGDEYYRHEVLFATDADWPTIRRGFELMLQRSPSSWTMNKFAMFACLAQDRETTRSLLASIGADVVPEAWYDGQMHAYCLAWAAA